MQNAKKSLPISWKLEAGSEKSTFGCRCSRDARMMTAAQSHIKRLDESIGPEKGGIPVRIHAHHQIKADQRKHQGKSQNIEVAINRHSSAIFPEIRRLLLPAAAQQAGNAGTPAVHAAA